MAVLKQQMWCNKILSPPSVGSEDKTVCFYLNSDFENPNPKKLLPTTKLWMVCSFLIVACDTLLLQMKELAVDAVDPHLFTIATLTGHAFLAVGSGYTIGMKNPLLFFF